MTAYVHFYVLVLNQQASYSQTDNTYVIALLKDDPDQSILIQTWLDEAGQMSGVFLRCGYY